MAQLLVRRDTIGQGSHVVSVRRCCRGPSAALLWHEVHAPFAAVNFALFRWILCIAVRNGAGVGPFVWHRAHCCTVLAAEAGCPFIAFALASRAGWLPRA